MTSGQTSAALWALVALLLAPSIASAQTLDELWLQYEEQTETFVTLQTDCDEGDVRATTTNRLCRRAVQVGTELADTIEALVARDEELRPDDEAALIDGALTTRQIAASILVDVGECEDARDRLSALLEDERLAERPNVEEAAERWMENAERCIADALAAEQPEPEETPEPALALAPEPPSRAGPLALLASGSALLVTGIAWDMANLSSIREFNDLNDACAEGSCDTARQGELKDRLDGAKVPIALLYGVGAATAVSGVVWMVLQGDGSDQAVAVRPYHGVGPAGGFYGVQLRTDW